MSEIWRPIIGYKDAYEVSSFGRVRSKNRIICRKNGVRATCRGRVLKPGLGMNGYYWTVALGRGNTRTVHSLVAAAFLGSCPENQEILHGGSGSRDNRVENLYYGTHSQNSFDRYRDGTVHNAKQVRRSDGKVFRSVHEAAKITGSNISCISCAVRGIRKSAAGFQWEYI